MWHGGRQGEDDLLAGAYRSSLELAREKGIKSLAFPSISTGAYRFPIERAARIALGAVWDFLRGNPNFLQEVRFVLFSQPDLEVYEQALAEILTKS
nr:macro domain-containing protein [Moorella sp. Hama-1]